mmetsp:Transcript_54235/g.100241  ORF Transcript_54235/g.100241 Transcript_54235/m.100241 type:complete len:266 (-) Transcript_54235:68-865(-)
MGAAVQSVKNDIAFPDIGDEVAESKHVESRPDFRWLRTASGNRIAAVHWLLPGATRTILFSHGNGELLAQFLDSDGHWLRQLSTACNANVLVYDYCGFGISQGNKSEAACYESIDAAYSYLTQMARPPVPASRLLVLGSSLGTAVSVDFVSRHPEIRGLVLLSPLESGVRTLPHCNPVVMSHLLYPFDAFKNYEKMPMVQCPVLICHGTDDDIISIDNGYRLQEACVQKVEPLWIAGGDHCLSWNFADVVWPRVRRFLDTEINMV